MLENLNDKQKEASTIVDGPLLIIAGAGSGKTRVLTTRIAYMIHDLGISPYSILAITFTNKAAREMQGRVINLVGPIAHNMQISTFHSFGLSILKSHYKLIGYKENFTIVDSDDTNVMIKKIIKEMNLDPKIYNPKAIKNQISGAKNVLMMPDEYEKYVNSDFEEKVLEVYKRYQKRLVANNSFDFDDLLLQPIIIFRKHPSVLSEYQERFHYILVDEYQDTNEAQYILTKMISAKYKNICVVGDESQSIYSWRGANYRNILNFENDYKNAKVVLLEENYRSTKTILNIANSVIVNNKERKDKNLWTDNDQGDKVTYKRCFDEKDEARYTSEIIHNLLKNGTNPNEIAVLYRTNAQSRAIEDVLLQDAIAYKVVGSFYFYDRREIKDLISYLKIIYNPNDDLSLLRVINTPKRGIGNVSISNLTKKASENNTSIYETINSGKEKNFKDLIEDLRSVSDTSTLTDLIEAVLSKTGIRDELISEKSIEADTRLENLEEFKSITKNYEMTKGIVSLGEFLEEISLVADPVEYKNNDDVVTLMTIHSAKGLEFDNVILIGVEENIFPHMNSLDSSSNIEEERRLFYVAVTRAKKKLWILNAKRRMLYGIDSMNPPSRFIKEINEDDLEIIDTKIEKNHEFTIDTSIVYNIGDVIIHKVYGRGVCVGIDDKTISIAFPHPIGIKKIIKGHSSISKED